MLPDKKTGSISDAVFEVDSFKLFAERTGKKRKKNDVGKGIHRRIRQEPLYHKTVHTSIISENNTPQSAPKVRSRAR